MPSIAEIEQEIVEEFEFFEDWTQRYEHLIELGKDLPLIDPKYKDADHLIKGCQSQVWLHADSEGDQVVFTADSDAIITKGIIALLVRVLSEQSAAEVAAAEMAFIDQIGLQEHLSPTRANGLRSMVKQMKLYATVIAAQSQANG